MISVRRLGLTAHRQMIALVQTRHYQQRQPVNLGIVFVPQQQAWIVERMGKYHAILEPGLQFLIPVLDRISYVQSLKEIAIEVPAQSAITVDNVALQLDGVLYLRVTNPYNASYGVEDPEFAVTQLAQTTMRSEVGKIALDTVFRERETLNDKIVESINKAATPWGIQCLRYEIRDMQMPPKVREAMQMQVEAERRKRASILESEGKRDAEINVAEGMKRSTILASEARREEQINWASGDAEAIRQRAEAKANALLRVLRPDVIYANKVADSLQHAEGNNAATLQVAEQYVKAFERLAKETNTIIVPNTPTDAAGMVAQAMSVYKSMADKPTALPLPPKSST